MEERRETAPKPQETGSNHLQVPYPLKVPALQESLCPRVSANTHKAWHLGPQTLSKPQAAAFLETSSLLSGQKHV